MRRTEQSRTLRFLGSSLVFACAASAAAATVNRVTVEAVDHYADGGGSIICIAEVDNFVNSVVTAPGSIWTRGVRYTDSCGGGASPPCSLVWDTDFVDPDRPGTNSFDNDTHNFDRAGDAISFVSVHGICNDVSNTSCTSTAGCGTNKVCIGPGPAGGAGWCASYQDRKLYVGHGAGTNNHHSGFINYSNGMMALGEDATYGSWGNASTNGGVNFAAVVNSCGVRPGFIIQETWQMFAGVQNVGMVMPVTPQGADDVDAPDRGTAFAQAYRTNPNGSIGLAWRDSLLNIPQNDGSSCAKLNGDYSKGGGHGIAGCGAQIALSLDINQATAEWDNRIETWNQAQNTANKGYGSGWESWTYRCNYACNSFPFTL